MAYNVVFLLAVLCTTYVCSLDNDDYSALFYDNKEVFVDRPIKFEYPLPSWLRGSLVRTGPGMFGSGARNFTHVFDGFAKLYSWKFYGDGNASFSMNFIRSEGYNVTMEKNDIDTFMTYENVTPPFSTLEKEKAVLRGFDNTNVNVYRFFKEHREEYEYVALTDAWKFYQIDPVSVSTLGPINAEKPSGTTGFMNMMSSAHPVPEYNSTHHFTFLTSVSLIPGAKHKISLVRIKSSNQRELVAQWQVDKAPYMHAFSVTPNYVILFASPYFINKEKLFKYGNAFGGLEWFPSEKATIYVIKIKNGNVHTFKTPNVYIEHHVNAYEENGMIIMDVHVFKDPYFAKILELPIVRSSFMRQNSTYNVPEIKRYTIDLKKKNITVSSFQQDPLYPFINNFELPCINEQYRHQKYCLVYGVANKMDNKLFSKTALVKKDVCGTNQEAFWSVDNHYPMEMWFVPSPNATQEDDGILLTPVLDGEKQQSYLMILDAITMAPINRAYLPSLIPYTIHGRFFPYLV